MKKLFVLSIVAIFSASVFAGPMAIISTRQELDNFLKKVEFNGVLLVQQDNKILMKEAYGVKNFATKEPLKVTDRFQIGSVSKQFTSASLLKLQEEGRISIDDKVTKYLPQYPAYEKVTIRDLLNHSSGINNYTELDEFYKILVYEKTLSLDDILKFIAPYPFYFEPKSNYTYSNTNYIIAGKILEIVSGKSWNGFLNDEFLEPLKMKDTGYKAYFSEASDVFGYVLDEKREPIPMTEYNNTSWALSAGALYSTVDDLVKWTAIYDDSNLLSEFSKKEMQTPFLANYGLGVMSRKFNNDTRLFHTGRTPGFKTALHYLKDSKLKVVTFNNTDGGWYGDISYNLLEYFANGSFLALKLDTYPLDSEKLKQYEGVFKNGDQEFTLFVKDGKLFLQPTDQRPYLLRASDVDSFNLEDFCGEEFIRNAQGEIISLNHYQGGGLYVYTKIK